MRRNAHCLRLQIQTEINNALLEMPLWTPLFFIMKRNKSRAQLLRD